jgi:hypothetical protein
MQFKYFIQQFSLQTAILLLLIFGAYGQDSFIFTERIYDERVATPLVFPEGNPTGFPLVEALSTAPLEFHFDLLGNDRPTLSFGIIHCTKNWERSDLIPSQYIIGFPWTTINNQEVSFNTQIDYLHYQFNFPNQQMIPKYSGNYAVVVFSGSDIENTDNYLLIYRILVFDNSVGIRAKVSASTVPGHQRSHQQVDFDVIPGNLKIVAPMRDISASIIQNYDWQNAKTGLKPIFIEPNALTFDYNDGENEFGGGSEWRQFEFTNFNFRSLHVADIVQQDDGRHVYLDPDIPLGSMVYSGYQDLDGATVIETRANGVSNSHLEADYAHVHYFMKMPPLAEGKLFLNDRFTSYKPSTVACNYLEKINCYECVALMKQGAKNYRYSIEDRYHSMPDLSYTEGNHAETENNYIVVVYFQDIVLGCDRIVGLYTLNTFN